MIDEKCSTACDCDCQRLLDDFVVSGSMGVLEAVYVYEWFNDAIYRVVLLIEE